MERAAADDVVAARTYQSQLVLVLVLVLVRVTQPIVERRHVRKHRLAVQTPLYHQEKKEVLPDQPARDETAR